MGHNLAILAVSAATACICALLLEMTGMEALAIAAVASTFGLIAMAWLIDRKMKRQNRENEKPPSPRSVDQIIADRARNSPF